MSDKSDVFIISGIPGAGKTTVARMLAESFERGVHIEGDVVGHQFIASGLVAPHQEPVEERERQLNLRRRNIVLLANSFLKESFVVVVDDVVLSSSVLTFYKESLNSPIKFVQLCPHPDVISRRDAAREKHVYDIWAHLQSDLEQMPREGLWIDTSQMTADATVQAIHAGQAEALIA